MPFRFRLEKVKRVRRRLVDQQSQRLAAAQRDLEAAAVRLGEVERRIARTLEAAAAPAVRLDLDLRRRQLVWLEHLRGLRQRAAAELTAAEDAAAAERRRLMEAWRDLEVLQKLESRQQRTWLEEEARRESRILDEIGQNRAARQGPARVASRQEQVT